MNILIVEDELPILENLINTVSDYESSSIIVWPFDKPKDALSSALQNNFDLALIDIQLPEMNGVDLARKMKQEQPNLKIIFTTAYNNYAAEAFEIEATDYLLKPIRKEKLFSSIEKAMAENKKAYDIRRSTNNLRIELFGHLSLYNGNEPIKWKRVKSAELFAFLLLHINVPVSKFILCEELWPEIDENKALVNLQTAIYQLRRTLSVFSRSQIKIEYADNHYCMILNNCQIDLFDFDNAYNNAKALQIKIMRKESPDRDMNFVAEKFSVAVKLYSDSLLGYEGWPWIYQYQSEQEKKYIEALAFLIDYSYQGQTGDDSSRYLNLLASTIGEEELSYDEFLKMYSSIRK
jgi:two-component SAPR family response regulator